jgi:hypothetical protein
LVKNIREQVLIRILGIAIIHTHTNYQSPAAPGVPATNR